MKPINEIEAKEYDRYASPDHTKARRAQAHGLVKMCQIPPKISNVPIQMWPPIMFPRLQPRQSQIGRAEATHRGAPPHPATPRHALASIRATFGFGQSDRESYTR